MFPCRIVSMLKRPLLPPIFGLLKIRIRGFKCSLKFKLYDTARDDIAKAGVKTEERLYHHHLLLRRTQTLAVECFRASLPSCYSCYSFKQEIQRFTQIFDAESELRWQANLRLRPPRIS